MTVLLEILAWSALAAAAAWGTAQMRASAALERLHAEMQREIHYLQAEAARARTRAAQLAQEIATWSDGRRQGCADVIALVPLLAAAHERCACAPQATPAPEMNAGS